MNARERLLVLLLALQPVLHAAEAQPAEPRAPEQTPAETPRAPDASGGADEAGAGPDAPASEDVFVPSIEVSEDTSVPFPVDI